MPNVRCEQVDGRFPEAAPRECGKIYSDDKAQWGASAGTWKLCSGLFLLQPGNASLDFVDRWAERLANKQAGAKNQPHYNAALAQSNLSATVLPCDLFPNGHRPPHPTAAQTPTQTLTYPQLHPKPHRDHPKPHRDHPKPHREHPKPHREHPKPHREQATATRARRGAGRRAAPP